MVAQTPTQKIPGWGIIQPADIRSQPNGRVEFLICPDGHDAPFWAGLQEIHRHKGRIIYQEPSND